MTLPTTPSAHMPTSNPAVHASSHTTATAAPTSRLTVLYDGRCDLCLRVRQWMQQQVQLVTLRFIDRHSPLALHLYPTLVPGAHPDQMIVVADDGAVYRGDAAYLMCLWALRDTRILAQRLASPLLRPLARKAFALLSDQRHRLSRWFSGEVDDLKVIETIHAAGSADEPCQASALRAAKHAATGEGQMLGQTCSSAPASGDD